MVTEDHLVNYLHKLPPETCTIVAANAAKRLLYLWEHERRRMLERDDPREVMLASPVKIDELHAELDPVIMTILPSDLGAEQHVIESYDRFPPDEAAWFAFKVFKHFVAWRDRQKLRPQRALDVSAVGNKPHVLGPAGR